jgi:hypothetical protein
MHQYLSIHSSHTVLKMTSIAATLRSQQWTRDGYLISTDISIIPLETLKAAIASSTFYWAKPMPDHALQETLENSLCFGLYKTGSENKAQISAPLETGSTARELVGFARCITDYTTFLYLTDVWVEDMLQGQGLGKWIIQCVQETILKMPYLRRSMLFTADWERSVPFYEKLMDMTAMQTQKGEGLAVMERKGEGHPTYGSSGNGYN